jgi:hypothetical protein
MNNTSERIVHNPLYSETQRGRQSKKSRGEKIAEDNENFARHHRNAHRHSRTSR